MNGTKLHIDVNKLEKNINAHPFLGLPALKIFSIIPRVLSLVKEIYQLLKAGYHPKTNTG